MIYENGRVKNQLLGFYYKRFRKVFLKQNLNTNFRYYINLINLINNNSSMSIVSSNNIEMGKMVLSFIENELRSWLTSKRIDEIMDKTGRLEVYYQLLVKEKMEQILLKNDYSSFDYRFWILQVFDRVENVK